MRSKAPIIAVRYSYAPDIFQRGAFAPTRSGKGVGLVIPTLLSWTGSAVIHDIKGENFAVTAGWRQLFSHCLYVNPTDPRSAAYNPLSDADLAIIQTSRATFHA